MSKKNCTRCDTPLNAKGYCKDETCPFSDHLQSCPAGWTGHPEVKGLTECNCKSTRNQGGSMIQPGDKNVKVISRTGNHTGHTTGATRICTLEGCRGRRIVVKWDNGKVTYPCTKGMSEQNGAWKIE